MRERGGEGGLRKIGGDSGGIHTNLGGTRFTLRENSGVHSRTSKSRNSISAANRSRQTCEKVGGDGREGEEKRMKERTTFDDSGK